MQTNRKHGSNFDEEPLSFEEFINCFNNFFYNLSIGRHTYISIPYGYVSIYGLLKEREECLAEELSTVYEHKGYFIRDAYVDKYNYPEEILRKGFKAYLLLREDAKNESKLLEKIKEYRIGNRNPNAPDDCAFFA